MIDKSEYKKTLNIVANVYGSSVGFGSSDKSALLGDFSAPCYNYSISDTEISQEKIEDTEISQELQEKFEPKKILSELLFRSYERLRYYNKADNVLNCGNILVFRKPFDASEQEKAKLHRANFCKDRLCPTCAWRRTLKIFSQVSKIMDVIENQYRFIFVTLTVPNCSGDALIDTINALLSGFKRFCRYKPIQNLNKGFFRALEITYNKERNDFHPHFHLVFAVPKSYFKSSIYLNQKDWLSLWQKAMRDDTISQVDVRTVKNNYTGGKSVVSEIAKYTVKSSDYLFPDDKNLTDDLVYTLTDALYKRRLFQMGGVFKYWHKRLNLQDCESDDADLLNIDADKIRPDVAYMFYTYHWFGAKKEYVLTNSHKECNICI